MLYAMPAPVSGALCPACGNQMPPPTGKAGRPAEVCSEDCRAVWKLVRDAEVTIQEIQDKATPQGWLRLRGILWHAVNGRAWNRGLRAITDSRCADRTP